MADHVTTRIGGFTMKRVMHTLGAWYSNVSVFFFAVLFLSVLAQIIMRNMFNSGSAFIEELSRFSLVSSVFLMIPVLTLRGQQIVVDILLNLVPAGARRRLDSVLALIGASFGIFILYAIALIMKNNWNVRTPAMRMPNVLFYLPVFLGILFFIASSLHIAFISSSGKGEAE